MLHLKSTRCSPKTIFSWFAGKSNFILQLRSPTHSTDGSLIPRPIPVLVVASFLDLFQYWWWSHFQTHYSTVGNLIPRPIPVLLVTSFPDPFQYCWWSHSQTHSSTVGGLIPRPWWQPHSQSCSSTVGQLVGDPEYNTVAVINTCYYTRCMHAESNKPHAYKVHI